MSFELVNIHGQPWRPSQAATTQPVAGPKQIGKDPGFHKGFEVSGYPPQRLEKAAAEHAALRKSVPSTPEWDVGVYMRTHRPTVPHKPYATLSSAEEMRDYLARMGWLNCAVRELKREAQE